MPQKGFSAGDTIANMGIAEIQPKSNFPSQTVQVSEDSSVVPTPVKKSGKSKQQLDIKAELEKRQGGKHLLNLVVIGIFILVQKWKIYVVPLFSYRRRMSSKIN